MRSANAARPPQMRAVDLARGRGCCLPLPTALLRANGRWVCGGVRVVLCVCALTVLSPQNKASSMKSLCTSIAAAPRARDVFGGLVRPKRVRRRAVVMCATPSSISTLSALGKHNLSFTAPRRFVRSCARWLIVDCCCAAVRSLAQLGSNLLLGMRWLCSMRLCVRWPGLWLHGSTRFIVCCRWSTVAHASSAVRALFAAVKLRQACPSSGTYAAS